jgi:hypothetical protein
VSDEPDTNHVCNRYQSSGDEDDVEEASDDDEDEEFDEEDAGDEEAEKPVAGKTTLMAKAFKLPRPSRAQRR